MNDSSPTSSSGHSSGIGSLATSSRPCRTSTGSAGSPRTTLSSTSCSDPSPVLVCRFSPLTGARSRTSDPHSPPPGGLRLTLPLAWCSSSVSTSYYGTYESPADSEIGIIAPILYYTNTWYAKYLPISSTHSFDNTGKSYDVTQIIDENNSFDLEKYKAYSPLFLSTTFALSYGLSFASITGTSRYKTNLFDGTHEYFSHSHTHFPILSQADLDSVSQSYARAARHPCALDVEVPSSPRLVVRGDLLYVVLAFSTR